MKRHNSGIPRFFPSRFAGRYFLHRPAPDGRTLELITHKARLGAAPSVELCVAERDLLDTRRQAVRLRLEHARAAIRLVQATGAGRVATEAGQTPDYPAAKLDSGAQVPGFGRAKPPAPR